MIDKRDPKHLQVGNVLVTTAGVPEFDKLLIHGVPPIFKKDLIKDEALYGKML